MPEECVICLRDILSHKPHMCIVYEIILPCGHGFHYKCISRWLYTSNTCPKCRREIDRDIYNIAFDTAGGIIDYDYDTEYVPEVAQECGLSRKCRYSKRLVKKVYNLRTR